MPNKDRNIPKRRFKEFENADAWELRKLGEVAPLRGGFAFKSSDFVEDGIPIVRISNILSNGHVGAEFVHFKEQEQDERFTLYDGAAVLAMSGATTGKVSVLHVNDGEKYYQNQRVGYFTPTQRYNYDFIKVIVNSTFFITQLSSVLVAGAQPNISSKEVDDFCFTFPKSFSEQEAIGTFFSTLDRHITLHQRKLDKLKSVKQAYLSEMFPAEGERVPKRRFPGFTDDWELRKLGEIAEMYSGGTPSVGRKEFYEGDIPFIRSAEINSHNTELFISELGLSNSSAKMVSEGTLLYALYGATSGEVGLSKISGAINQAILAIIPSIGYSSSFLLQWLKREKNNIIEKYLQGGQGNLSGAIVKDFFILFPTLSEQEAIGTFFSTLDRHITLHQRKLEKLKNLKKALLNELFV
ncbi:restriction endonuclease subunit S [Streptococcus suis]|nr:restriction endonuclease subunit S [Streptococcus suis]